MNHETTTHATAGDISKSRPLCVLIVVVKVEIRLDVAFVQVLSNLTTGCVRKLRGDGTQKKMKSRRRSAVVDTPNRFDSVKARTDWLFGSFGEST